MTSPSELPNESSRHKSPAPKWRERAWGGSGAKDWVFACRSLIRARGFTLTVLGTLVVGLGAATAVFMLADRPLFQSQPYPHAEELVLIGYRDKTSPFVGYCTGFHLQAYQEQTDVFAAFAAVSRRNCNVGRAGGDAKALDVVSASVDCFRTLGIAPRLGRAFLAPEFESGANNVVVISDEYWQQLFDRAPDVLGREILIDGQPCTVVGVLAPGQRFPRYFDGQVFRPLAYTLDPALPFDVVLNLIGRMKPGVTAEQARAALESVRLNDQLPVWVKPFYAEQSPVVASLRQLERPDIYWVLVAAGALLYAVAILNAMNLSLVRLLARRRELSIRLAIGGARSQIARLLMIESGLLALAATALVAGAACELFPHLFFWISGNPDDMKIPYWGWRACGFLAAFGALTWMAVTAVPVVRLFRSDIAGGLKEGGATLGESRGLGRLRNGLVVLQAAFAVMLLIGTGLMVRTFQKLQQVDLGFDPAGKVKVWIMFPKGADPKPEARLQLFDKLRDRVQAIPGVKAVSYGQDALLVGKSGNTAQVLMPDGSYLGVAGCFIAADYRETAGLTVTRGRWITDDRGPVEMVINESLAKARFGDTDPIGQHIKLLVSGSHEYEVVGVVRDVRDSVRAAPPKMLYSAAWVYPPNIGTLVIRVDRDPDPLFGDRVSRAIGEVDPRLIVSSVKPINELISMSLATEHYVFAMLKGVSAIATLLAVVGLFSVITYTVANRMPEFGVRVALGALPRHVVELVVRRGLVLAAAGVAVGVAAAAALTRFLQSLLFETTPYDPVVYLVVAALLLAAAVLACWLPARRAGKVDVVRLLRAE